MNTEIKTTIFFRAKYCRATIFRRNFSDQGIQSKKRETFVRGTFARKKFVVPGLQNISSVEGTTFIKNILCFFLTLFCFLLSLSLSMWRCLFVYLSFCPPGLFVYLFLFSFLFASCFSFLFPSFY